MHFAAISERKLLRGGSRMILLDKNENPDIGGEERLLNEKVSALKHMVILQVG